MSLGYWVLCLCILILLSAFFAISETSLMAINRYRLRHLVRSGRHPAAQRVSQLLERPDKLLSVILLGSTFANLFAASVATLITVQWIDAKDQSVVLSTIILALFILIFAEVFPKTLAAIYSQRVAFLLSWPLVVVSTVLYPFAFLINGVSQGLLKILHIKMPSKMLDPLSHEELRSVLGDVDSSLPRERVAMLLGLLDLHQGEVQDIMVARRDIVGIDLMAPIENIRKQLLEIPYSRAPLFHDSIDHALGFLDVRQALMALHANENLSKEDLLSMAQPVQFIPETVSLYTQLIQFQKNKTRLAFCVDEYGDIQGLATIHDILEEVIGEFTTDDPGNLRGVQVLADGSAVVRGSILVRELNRDFDLDLPVDGPKTLAGLVIEYLETIPESPVCLTLYGLRLEVEKIKDHRIQRIKILKT